jgi:hypothetical protein
MRILMAGIEGGASFNDYCKRRNTAFPTVTADGGTNPWIRASTAPLGLNSTLAHSRSRLLPAWLGLCQYSDVTEAASILALQYGGPDITTTSHAVFGSAAAFGEVGYEELFSTSETYSAKCASNTAHADKRQY